MNLSLSLNVMSLEKPLCDHLMDQSLPFQLNLYTLPHFISFKILISIWNYIKIFFVCMLWLVSPARPYALEFVWFTRSPLCLWECQVHSRYSEIFPGWRGLLWVNPHEKHWGFRAEQTMAGRLSYVGMKIPGNFWKWFCWSSSRGWLICHPGVGIRTSNH